MEARPQTYAELIAGVRNEFGVSLEVVNTGGGCNVMYGRLDSGHWLVVQDADDFLARIEDQLEADAEDSPLGWFVGVYDNEDLDGVQQPASFGNGGCVDFVRHDDARFHQANEVIREALGKIASRESAD